MTPTKIQAVRVLLALVAVGVFPRSLALGLGAIALFVVAEALDALDGHLARRRGVTSAFGGILDVSTDQLIELLYWFLFLSLGLVPLWIPIVIAVRGALVHLIRVRALEAGRSAFGPEGILQGRWGRALVASRASRGLMVAVKVAGFTALQLAYLADRFGPTVEPRPLTWLGPLGLLLLQALVLIHLARGVVYVVEGRALLRTFGWSGTERAAPPPPPPRPPAPPAGRRGPAPLAPAPPPPR